MEQTAPLVVGLKPCAAGATVIMITIAVMMLESFSVFKHVATAGTSTTFSAVSAEMCGKRYIPLPIALRILSTRNRREGGRGTELETDTYTTAGGRQELASNMEDDLFEPHPF